MLGEWKPWFDENRPYLRFDPATARFRLDEDAQRAGQPVPAEAQQAQRLQTPLPGWTGPVPE
jgi:hypothetical protein